MIVFFVLYGLGIISTKLQLWLLDEYLIQKGKVANHRPRIEAYIMSFIWPVSSIVMILAMWNNIRHIL